MNLDHRWSDRFVYLQTGGMLALVLLLAAADALTLPRFYVLSCLCYFVLGVVIAPWRTRTQTIKRLYIIGAVLLAGVAGVVAYWISQLLTL